MTIQSLRFETLFELKMMSKVKLMQN